MKIQRAARIASAERDAIGFILANNVTDLVKQYGLFPSTALIDTRHTAIFAAIATVVLNQALHPSGRLAYETAPIVKEVSDALAALDVVHAKETELYLRTLAVRGCSVTIQEAIEAVDMICADYEERNGKTRSCFLDIAI